jgi:sigma-B regulation protein RsbU (phosphoserine phosphatase)
VTLEEFRLALRADAGKVVLGIIISFAGLLAAAAQVLRRKSKERLLLWFGLFAGIYGLRLLLNTGIVRFTLDFRGDTWRYFASALNYLILVPAVLFFEEIYGKGWKSCIRIIVWAFFVYALAGIVTDIVRSRPAALPDPGTGGLILVPLALVIGRQRGYRPPRIAETGALRVGFGVFAITVLKEHLANAGLLFKEPRIEPAGFLVLIVCLGYIAVRRFLANEQQLLAIEEEMKAASRIQAAILPRSLPLTSGLRIAVRYVPMTAVAGDFYDFLQVGEQRLGILVADVTGHGVPAALVASMIKVATTAQAAHATDPARVIGALNEMICRQVGNQFCTACYVFVDAETGRAVYSAAGHPPALLWQRQSGTMREFRENGLLLGVRATETYSNLEFELQPGDRLFLYTDGIVEAADAAEEFFGEDRLKDFIARHQDLDAEKFAEALIGKVQAWSGTHGRGAQSDDLTLVVVDRDA